MALGRFLWVISCITATAALSAACDRTAKTPIPPFSDPININQNEGELLLPKAPPLQPPFRDVVIEVTPDWLLVNSQRITPLASGRVDDTEKRDGPNGFFIDKLFKALKTIGQHKRKAEKQGSRSFRGAALIVSPKSTPKRLLAEVLYTANQAEFKTYVFAAPRARVAHKRPKGQAGSSVKVTR